MSTSIVERVHRLIALSASGNENEARSAAYEACRLIREHRLEVTVAYRKPEVGGGPSAGQEEPMSDLRRDVNSFLDGIETLIGKKGGIR